LETNRIRPYQIELGPVFRGEKQTTCATLSWHETYPYRSTIGKAIELCWIANPLYILKAITAGIGGVFGGTKFSKDKYLETHVSFRSCGRECSRRRGAAVAPSINSHHHLWWPSDAGSVFLTLQAREIPRLAMGVGCRTGRRDKLAAIKTTVMVIPRPPAQANYCQSV